MAKKRQMKVSQAKKVEKNHPEIERQIIENLIALQKINVNLTEKFDSLSKQLSDLLTLFEMTARRFAEHPAIQASEKDKEFLDKIDKLLDQNKTIAKGLTLMEDRMRERLYGASNTRPASKDEIGSQSSSIEEEKEPYSQSLGSRPLPRF